MKRPLRTNTFFHLPVTKAVPRYGSVNLIHDGTIMLAAQVDKPLLDKSVFNLKLNLRNIAFHQDIALVSRATHIVKDMSSPKTAAGLDRAHGLNLPRDTKTNFCDVFAISIPVKQTQGRDEVPGYLHLPHGYQSVTKKGIETAAILLSGAGGGVFGPSSIYLSIGDKLASLRRGIPVLRLNYRFPARIQPCCQDVVSAMNWFRAEYQVSKFVLVGWSFGSAPVFTVAADHPAVIGCAAIAGQTAGTSGIRSLHPRPLLLLHGTGDRTLSERCSQTLYNNYGRKGNRQIHLFDGDNHALTQNSLRAEEILCRFIAKCANVSIEESEQQSLVEQELMDASTKIELMHKGGDLRGTESIA